jgi:CubicO group peptidase (beta-lactamase class C family)
VSSRFASVRTALQEAVGAKATPAVVLETGDETAAAWRQACGRLTYDDDAPAVTAETIFDLASLTKVIATATLVMHAVEERRLDLDERVATWIPDWRGADREGVTIRDLLEHCSGLTAYLPLFRDCSDRTEFRRAIATLPLEYPPRTQSLYSDLGFILLGFILEEAGGTPLPTQFKTVARLVGGEPLAFTPPRDWRARMAPTEVDTWRGRLLVGEVHDENAWALGGTAGHSGLFGTTAAVGTFARLVLQTLRRDSSLARRDTLRAFVQRSAVPGSSRALAWDTMRTTSSCGHLMSTRAVGHTGFTGTSVWIDPDRGIYVVLLSNRVHPSRTNEQFRSVRPLVHDEVMRAWGF